MSEAEAAEAAVLDIIREYREARAKKGPFSSPWSGESVMRGELQELSDAVWGHLPEGTNRREAMREEAAQVGAMALQFLVDFYHLKREGDIGGSWADWDK